MHSSYRKLNLLPAKYAVFRKQKSVHAAKYYLRWPEKDFFMHIISQHAAFVAKLNGCKVTSLTLGLQQII